MKELRMSQVINILMTLNEMYLKDFDYEYANFSTDESKIFIDAKNRYARIAIEELLECLQNLSICVNSNTELEILFWD